MKKFLFLGLMILALSCKSTSKVSVEAHKNNIQTILNKWHKAATDANFDAYFTKMDSISVFIGTDASENWDKKAFQDFSKPYFEKGKAWSFEPIQRNIYFNKNTDTAWFDELLITWMGTCRGSGVLELINNEWKIKHYVLSVTIPNDDIQKVIVATKERDSIFQATFKKKFN